MKTTTSTMRAHAALCAAALALLASAAPAQESATPASAPAPQAAPAPAVAQAPASSGDAAAGARHAAMCIGCHGIEGYRNAFPELHQIPKISGQNEAFIIAALTAYRSGDRRHPTMRAIAQSLTDQQIADLAAFYSSNHRSGSPRTLAEQPSQPPSERVAQLLAKGDCISCHGANFSTALDPSYPKIAGQHPDYLYVAMKAYTIEGNPLIGRSNPVMAGVARQFTLDEMRALARYMGTLDGALETVPQRRLRIGSKAPGE